MIPRKFSDMFANRKVVSNISRVETERETIAAQTVLENMNFDDYQRPKTQDQTNNYQRKYVVLEDSRKYYTPLAQTHKHTSTCFVRLRPPHQSATQWDSYESATQWLPHLSSQESRHNTFQQWGCFFLTNGLVATLVS